MSITGVIFDFDGVLADTERLHLASTQAVLAGIGLEMSEADYVERYLGYGDRDLFRAFADDCRVTMTAEEIERLIEAKSDAYRRALAGGTVLYDGVERTIFALKQTFTLAVASGAFLDEIESILATRPGLRDAFAAIVSADDRIAGKPSPEPYLEALRRLGMAAGNVIAVEDSPWGLDAARAAGLRTIAVTTSYPAGALQADLVLASVAEVTTDVVRSLAS
jgi:beta-phosphoglucomutase